MGDPFGPGCRTAYRASAGRVSALRASIPIAGAGGLHSVAKSNAPWADSVGARRKPGRSYRTAADASADPPGPSGASKEPADHVRLSQSIRGQPRLATNPPPVQWHLLKKQRHLLKEAVFGCGDFLMRGMVRLRMRMRWPWPVFPVSTCRSAGGRPEGRNGPAAPPVGFARYCRTHGA